MKKFVLWFAIAGGVGIPGLFLLLWLVVEKSLLANGPAMVEVMTWLEAFRVLFWPSSLLIVGRASGDTGANTDLIIAILTNVFLYGLIGAFAAIALRHRIAQVVLVISVIAGVYYLNAFWTQHFFSFLISAGLLGLLFALLFWKYDARGTEHGR